MRLSNKILRNVYRYTFGQIEFISISLSSFRKKTPILIYQMGKVGSSTVDNSLKKSGINNRTYHIHFLSKNGIDNAAKYYTSINAGLPRHLLRSMFLRKKILGSKGVKWKLITLVREPIGREISNIYQNIIDSNPELINKDGKINSNEVTELLEENFLNFDQEKNFTCSWFDNELKRAIGFDIYAESFNKDKGYSIYNIDNIDILVIRIEDMDSFFDEAIKDFFGWNKSVPMIRANIGDKKTYSGAYKKTTSNIFLAKETCEKIYNSKYVKHFYSQKMIESFFVKWGRNC